MIPYLKRVNMVGLVVMGWLLMTLPTSAQLEVKIQKDPDRERMTTGEELWLEARTKDFGVRCEWTLDGPGTLEGNVSEDCMLLYVAPDGLDAEGVAHITVVVTGQDQQTASASTAVTIQPPLPTPTPLPSPSPTPTPTPQPTAPPQVHQVLLPYNDDAYYLLSGETATMVIDLSGAWGENIAVECSAIRGNATCDRLTLTYEAPDRAGTQDVVMVKIRDSATADILDQTAVRVKIIAREP